MDKNYFHIREIARYLDRELKGAVLEEAFTQEKGKLVIGFTTGSEELFLEFSIAKKAEYIVLRDSFGKAKKNVAELFPELAGAKIEKSELYNDDRIISLQTNEGYQILFSFIRSMYNCFVVKDGVVVNAFKNRNEVLQKSVQEIFPERHSSESGKEMNSIKDYIKGKYAEFGNLYQKEAVFRTGLDWEDELEGNENVIDDEFTGLGKLMDEAKYLFYSSGDDVKTSLVALEHLRGYEKKEFKDINELIEYQNKFKYKEDKTKDVLGTKIDKVKKELAHAESNINNLQKTVEEFKNADKYRIYGELLLANIAQIEEGDEAMEVVDPLTYEKIKIKLKKDLKPAENANHYFDKYKRQKNAIGEIEKKVKSFEKEKAKLEEELERLENMEDFKEVKKLEKEVMKESKPDETSRFRKFVLNDKYEVWVGKDSRSNDLLTTKYSAPHDLWFHVRGSSGSHTVLKVSHKKDDVNKEVIKKAAAISAYYSKARNASMVPVAYCEKKHVKKPKGAKAGAVVMSREKVVNVKPGLPEDAD